MRIDIVGTCPNFQLFFVGTMALWGLKEMSKHMLKTSFCNFSVQNCVRKKDIEKVSKRNCVELGSQNAFRFW